VKIDKKKSGRRKVLKSISAGFVTTTGLSGVAVAQEGGLNQNGGVVNQSNKNPFNPNDLRAAHEYAKE
jgi:hypothetical protein